MAPLVAAKQHLQRQLPMLPRPLFSLSVAQSYTQCMLEKERLFCVIHFAEPGCQLPALFSLMKPMQLLLEGKLKSSYLVQNHQFIVEDAF
jgi:hypothetical protein